MRRARLIRDGLSWRQACLQSGYSLATANRGPRGYLDNKPGVQKDFARAAEEVSYKPEFVKKAVTHRLMTAIIEGKSSEVAREAELLGKFKEHDFFVNPANATSMSIIAVLADPDGEAIFNQTAAAMKDYAGFSCAWCEQGIEGAEALQTHSLTCQKKPLTIFPRTISP